MGEKIKVFGMGIGAIVAFIALAFILTLGGLWWKGFFAPKYQNVERKVFEETKSYVHGKNEDLAKYFEEYQKAKSAADRQIIQEFVKMRFSEFKAENINSPRLRQFLVAMRGY